jgi:hypothetical protein
MRKPRSLSLLSAFGVCGLVAVGASSFAEDVDAAARQQILAIEQQKAARTPAQRKMDSQLIYALEPAAFRSAAPEMLADVEVVGGRVLLDITVRPTARRSRPHGRLHARIVDLGGTVMSSFPQFSTMRAWLPLAAVESLAADPEVVFVERAAELMTNTGSVTGQGDVRHRAAATRNVFGVTGAGITVGVISDSEDNLAGAQASLDIGAVNVVASGINTCGPTGTGPCTGEGTAMMEIVADLAPGAGLAFATANGGPAQMAANILALQAAGATVIVDDVTYFSESPFQDGPISQAVNTVSAAGVLYFSSARNSGNLNDGTAGTWEGDFADGGAVAPPIPGSGRIHSFGASTFDTVAGGTRLRVDLFWADPLGGSNNDYDLYVLNATGTAVVQSSTNSQTGTQNPYESIGPLNVGERIVIVRAAAAANRFLHLDTGRGILTIATNGNVRGHNASGALNAFSVAATDVANSPGGAFTGGAANPVETFSSDGPRRMFFDPAGNPFTPGNFGSTGGIVLQKPDITAADGAASSASSAGFNPFFGTSAAAPHAAAIAALLRSFTPAPTPAQIRAALNGSALDIEAPGFDRDSGVGIVMAFGAMKIIAPCTVTCAGSVTRSNDPDQCGAVTTFAAPTLAGTCGAVTCTPPSGSFFPVGSTPVLCETATEDSCSLTVTVNDTQDPVITCPANLTVPNDPGLCSAVVSYRSPTVTDNCPGAGPAVCAPPSGSVFPKGTTPVACSASDASANPASCGFAVTVLDTEAPKVFCAVGTPRLWPPNHNLVNVGLTVSATDNCPGALPLAVRVFGDEDDEMPTGDGNFSPDAKDIAPVTLRLRSERRGDADGRVYLGIESATDTSANPGFACCTVVVPHSNGPAAGESVALQAAAAQSHCAVHHAAPPGYFVVGDGPILGPKQ